MNLDAELHRYAFLRDELLRQFPEMADDGDLLLDTLEGATTLNEAIVKVWESARHDEGMVEAIKSRQAEMKERADRLCERAEKKRLACVNAMQEAGLKKIEAPEVTLSVRAVAPSVVVTDETLIPPAMLKTKTTTSPDKVAIKDALTSGLPVPGALLSNGGVSLSARVK
jgi:hypothetical protein